MAKGFDNVSKNYDQEFTYSNIGKAQRVRVFDYINPIISNQKKLSILELNCGTGKDAIKFAKLGHQILATDISAEMIDMAISKIKLDNLDFKVQDINTLKPENYKQFDLIFSNFGGLNCLSREELESFFLKSVNLLKPKGKLIMVIMSKKCLWERIYFFLKGDFKALRRRNTANPVKVIVSGTVIKTWYYSPREIVSLTNRLFKKTMIRPIGISIPPSYFENSFLSKKPFLNGLTIIEKYILKHSFWATYADHFLIEIEKI